MITQNAYGVNAADEQTTLEKTDLSTESDRNDAMDFRRFFSINLDLLCISTMEGIFVKLNRSWEDILGFDISELEGRKFLDFVHPDDIDETIKTMSVLRDGQQVLNFTNRYQCKNGAYKCIEWRSQPYGNYIYAAARDITERKKMEDQLREREANFRNFFDTVDDIIIVGDEQGRILYANAATVRKLGFALEELLQMQMIDLNPDENRVEAEQIFADMLAGKRNNCPLSLKKKDGTLLPVETSVWFGKWNGMDCIFGISNDLSIQQAALDQFYKLFNNNPALMSISNIENYKIMDVNTAFIEKLGYSKEEVIGKTSAELGIFEADIKQKMVETIRKEGSFKNLEIKVGKKDGEIIDGLFSGELIENQMDTALLTVMMDISELKKAEMKMAKQTGLIVSLLDSIQDIVFFKDLNGIYIGCNPKFAEYIGIPKEDIAGKTDYDLFDRETADSFRRFDLKMLEEKQPCNNEEWIVYPDGTNKLVETMKTPYFDIDGKLIGIIGVSRDITERKRREDKIEYLSFHDQLTGLYNRSFYETELSRLDKEKYLPLSFIMCDLNSLKLVNDAFGHAMGDRMIIRAAQIIREGCRAGDVVARIGGDEFVIMLPHSNAEETETVIDRIGELMMNEKVGAVDLSVSFGHATKTKKNQTVQAVFKNAEDQMYRRKLNDREGLRGSTIDVILKTLYERNPIEMTHSRRVSEYCDLIAETMNLSAEHIDQIRMAGLMHDIGKIGLEQDLLNHTEQWTEDDLEKAKKHPEIGYCILSSANEFSEVAVFVFEHHERWDGTGYPKGLTGENITLPARIIAVAEAYDAMTVSRTYKKVLDREAAVLEIMRCAGTQFDPEIALLFTEKVLNMNKTERSL